nr:hypothetical protein [Tanacetum cinerariifolium]
MGDKNPIRTLGDYSKPSHEGYKNTIELLVRNNMDLALYDNESQNDPKDFAKPVKVIALPQGVSSTFGRRLIELENQVQHLMEAHLALMQPTQVHKVNTSCEIYSGPHDTKYYMKGNSMAFEYIASISHIEREELRRKGIKSPLKLFFLKYLSPASMIKLNKNPSAPKRIHFVNSIVILSNESEAEDRETTKNITPKHSHHITKDGKEEVKVVMDEKEGEVVTDEEVEEILEDEEEDEDCENFNSFSIMEELTHPEWLLKNHRPP